MRKTVSIIIKLILAYVTAVAIAMVSGYGITGIEIILPCIFVLAYITYHKAYMRLTDADTKQPALRLKRDVMCSVPVGVLLSAGITVGAHYDIWNQTITPMGIKDILCFAVIAIFLTAAVLIMFGFIDSKTSDGSEAEKKTADVGKKTTFGPGKYLLIAGIMLICWLPYYLVLYPGNIGSDTIEEINMCLSNIPWTNHHPVFYTLLIDVVINLTKGTGSISAAMGLMSFLQSLMLALTLACVIKWLSKKSASAKDAKWKCLLALLFFALHPAVAMFSIYLSKDVLFSCALVLLTINLYDTFEEAGAGNYIQIGIWSLFTMLLRNNGLMIVVIVGILLLLVHRENYKKILPATIGAILVFLIFRSCAFGIFDIKPQSFAESASVPLQQTGYVIATSTGDSLPELSDEENNVLKSIMPYEKVREVYQLGYTDMLKFDEAFDDEYFNEHKGEYLSIWLRLLPTHMPDYVKAYLAQTAGYWHYGETNTLCTQGVTENVLGIERTDVIEKITGISLYGLIEKLMLLVRKAPVLCILTSMAMQFYMVILLMCSYIRMGKNRRILALMPSLVLWLTIMLATPAFCLFRYTFAMFILWPVFADELIG